MRNIQDDTKIAGSYTVGDWKKLRQKILRNFENDSSALWEEAFEIFRTRVKTRFLDPIDAIINMQQLEGEGFSAVALQCILVEFFESFYQGKVYVTPKSDTEISNQAHELKVSVDSLQKHLQPNEYRSSSGLFRDFLRGHKPFSESFTNRDLVDRFYSNIRCGLLHEAATKGSSRIRNSKGDLLIEEIPSSGKNMILYRTTFQKALKNYLYSYRQELLASRKRQIAFIRKMDDICQTERKYYFAYGSNLKRSRLQERIEFSFESYPECHKGFIKGFSLVFNKKSKDGSSKANLEVDDNNKVWGVCYELTENEYEKLKSYEGGYEEIKEVAVYSEDTKLLAVASTFISNQISEQPPTQKYFELVYEGAEEHGLPEDYLRFLSSLRPSS